MRASLCFRTVNRNTVPSLAAVVGDCSQCNLGRCEGEEEPVVVWQVVGLVVAGECGVGAAGVCVEYGLCGVRCVVWWQ